MRADAAAKKVLETHNVDVRYHSIIYDVIDEVKAAMSGMLSPERKQNIVGLAQVRDVFKHPKFGSIAGCMVTDGKITRNSKVRVRRGKEIAADSVVASLKRFKDDVKEVKAGFECGLQLKNYNDIKEGDQLEFFEVKEVARTL